MCSLHPLMLRSCADIRAAWREFPLTNRLGVRYEPAIDQPDEHTADRCRRPAHEHDARSGMKPLPLDPYAVLTLAGGPLRRTIPRCPRDSSRERAMVRGRSRPPPALSRARAVSCPARSSRGTVPS